MRLLPLTIFAFFLSLSAAPLRANLFDVAPPHMKAWLEGGRRAAGDPEAIADRLGTAALSHRDH